MNQPLIFDNVYRRFEERPVLRGLSLEVCPGEVFALLGRNGAGKTSAIRIALGLLDPHRGAVEVLGVRSNLLTGDDRERIGYVAEGHRLEDLRTVRRTIEYERATRRRFDPGYVLTWMKRIGISEKERVKELSRGQRAQLALVLVLAGRPELLIFDDPALGLDVVMRRELVDLLIDQLAAGGVSVLFTSHVLADVERLADRIGILHQGRLVVNATRDDLRSRVQQRFLRVGPDQPRDLPRLLHSRRLSDGYEVTLLDADERWLRERWGDQISDPLPLSMEDLFIALTSDPSDPDASSERGTLAMATEEATT